MRLRDRCAFVTAAAQGIGKAVALQLAAEGATVIATDINADMLQELRSERIQVRSLDVREHSRILELAHEFQEVDVIVNVAGWVHHGDILHCTEEDWDQTFDINVKSMFRINKAFIPSMIRRGRGSIINIASVQSSIIGNATRLAYGASKGAVIGLTKALAMGHAKDGVRCNVICPGVIDTPTVAQRVAACVDPEAERLARVAAHPIGRYGSPAEIASACVYLAGDESAFTTGSVLVVDGGYSVG